MAKSCKGLAEELVKCLSESTCVKGEKRAIRDCAGEKSPCIPSRHESQDSRKQRLLTEETKYRTLSTI